MRFPRFQCGSFVYKTLAFITGFQILFLVNRNYIFNHHDLNTEQEIGGMNSSLLHDLTEVNSQSVNSTQSYKGIRTIPNLLKLPQSNTGLTSDRLAKGMKVIGTPRNQTGFLTIGIPSVKRAVGPVYLLHTLQSIINKTSEFDKQRTVVVLFLSDEDENYNKNVLTKILERYNKFIESGFILVIQADKSLYPPLKLLKRNFGDPQDRVRWRSKQVVDFSLMFKFCENISTYYIQIEDDITCGDRFVPIIDEFIQSRKKPWTVLEFTSIGFIGKLFKGSDLDKLSVFMLTFFQEQPVDWLINFFRMTMTQGDKIVRKPNLFLHVGKKSSFAGNGDRHVQGKVPSLPHERNSNPHAIVISNMKAYQRNTPDNAFLYKNEVFWAVEPMKGDTLNIILDKDILLSKITVQTGTKEKLNDILRIGSVHISSKVEKMSAVNLEVKCSDPQLLGHFEKGQFQKDNIENLYKTKTKCIIITVGADQKDWIVFKDIEVALAN